MVEPDHRGAGQCRTTQREEVFGDVVGQHGHVEGPLGAPASQHEVGPAAALDEVVLMGPDPVLTDDRRTGGHARVGGVSGQQLGHAVGRERSRPERGARWVCRLVVGQERGPCFPCYEVTFAGKEDLLLAVIENSDHRASPPRTGPGRPRPRRRRR